MLLVPGLSPPIQTWWRGNLNHLTQTTDVATFPAPTGTEVPNHHKQHPLSDGRAIESPRICWIPWPVQVSALCTPCSDRTRDKSLETSRFMGPEVRLASGLSATRGSPYYWQGKDEVIWGQIVSPDQTPFSFIQPKLPYIQMAPRDFYKTSEI